ncbi:MAG: hypothetical protein QOD46_1001 [Actinomycetota bacterium]|nr:hypothetical protein [Actinomycetota bacterium]
MIRCLAVLSAAVLLAACTGTSGQTASGLGLPQVSVRFPANSAPGATHVAKLQVTNPGPGDMSSVVVAFSRTGPSPGATALPPPIVDVGFNSSNAAISAIHPRPVAVSSDGVVYRFGGLAVGKSITISFTLKVPRTPGVLANAMVVYDGGHTDRARGVRLQTVVAQ